MYSSNNSTYNLEDVEDDKVLIAGIDETSQSTLESGIVVKCNLYLVCINRMFKHQLQFDERLPRSICNRPERHCSSRLCQVLQREHLPELGRWGWGCCTHSIRKELAHRDKSCFGIIITQHLLKVSSNLHIFMTQLSTTYAPLWWHFTGGLFPNPTTKLRPVEPRA